MTQGTAHIPATTSAPALRIDGERLWASLMELARIGAYEDPATGLVGVNRQSLTDEDAEGRRLLIRWMHEAGLEVSVDEMGTIFGRREGAQSELAPVMAGSHIDSVATAGAFDGCLGVLGALEVVRSLNERGITTRRPLVIAAFTEEEGVRFGTDMLGSAVAAGRLTLEYAYDLVDAAGLRFGDELDRIGFTRSRCAWTLRTRTSSVISSRAPCYWARTARSAWLPGFRASRGSGSPCMVERPTPARRRPSCGSTRGSPPRRSS